MKRKVDRSGSSKRLNQTECTAHTFAGLLTRSLSRLFACSSDEQRKQCGFCLLEDEIENFFVVSPLKGAAMRKKSNETFFKQNISSICIRNDESKFFLQSMVNIYVYNVIPQNAQITKHNTCDIGKFIFPYTMRAKHVFADASVKLPKFHLVSFLFGKVQKLQLIFTPHYLHVHIATEQYVYSTFSM